MTFSIKNYTGYGNYCDLISYVYNAHTIFKNRASMKFFGDDCSCVVDVSVDFAGKLTSIALYPHNKKDVVNRRMEIFLNEVELAVAKLRTADEHRKVFTVNLTETGPVPVTRADFKTYSTSREIQDEMFIMDLPSDKGGFPTIYLMPKDQRSGGYNEFLPIFARSSNSITDCISEQTSSGKEFVYLLLKAYRHGEFDAKLPSSLEYINFPTKGTTQIPPFLKTDKLKAFADKVSSDIIITDGGETRLTPETVEEESTELVEESGNPSATDIFGEPDTKHLSDVVRNEIHHTSSVSLMSLLVLGIENVIPMIDDPSKIVSISIDVPDVASRMCIKDGIIHYIPTPARVSPGDFLSEPEDMFRECTEDDYPRGFPLVKSTTHIQ